MQWEILQGSPAPLPFSISFYCFYLKWKKKITQQRKPSIWRSMATFSIHAFPMSQGPSCALTHPADLLWLVGQSHGCAQHRETPRENRGKVLDAGAAIGDPGPQAFSPRISVCWLLTLLCTMKTVEVLESSSLVMGSGCLEELWEAAVTVNTPVHLPASAETGKLRLV